MAEEKESNIQSPSERLLLIYRYKGRTGNNVHDISLSVKDGTVQGQASALSLLVTDVMWFTT